MNRRIGYFSSLLNVASVVTFAISMLFPFSFLSYLSSIFIAISFIPMICSFSTCSSIGSKSAAYTSISFSIIYAVLIFVIYFAQITTVRNDNLNLETLRFIDYSKFGLFFNYNLLGYGFMALSTFFIGLTIITKLFIHKLLKALLLIHGFYFISCFIIPVLNVFNFEMSGGGNIGMIILEVWCIHFIGIGILSVLFFRNMEKSK